MMKKYKRELLWGGFALYCVCLLWILFFSRDADRTISLKEYLFRYGNIIPLKTTAKYIRYFFLKKDVSSFILGLYNIFGNFLLFLPMGIFLPRLFEKWKKKSFFLLRILCLIVTAEIFQIVFRVGIFDIDDVLLNFSGAFLGYVINRRLSEYMFDSIFK